MQVIQYGLDKMDKRAKESHAQIRRWSRG